MRKKQYLATFLYRSGALPWITSLTAKTITVFGYHRIRENAAPAGGYPYDEEVYGPTQSQFESQLQWLKQNFSVVSEDELLMAIRQRVIRDRLAVVTFDDGYRDNYELAYPVLRAHTAPAIFFVCPGLIDARALGWWDLIAYLVKKTKKHAISLGRDVFDLQKNKTAAAITELTTRMKSRPHDETAELVARLSEACDVALPDREQQSRELMTWAQLREVSRGGVAIGSHTHTHRVLGTLREEDQRWELHESKARLEAQLNWQVRTIAYPAGSRNHFTQTTMRLARECGYEGGFSYHSGVNAARRIDPFDIARIAPAADEFGAMFSCGAAIPKVFAHIYTPE
jgi:peptidoglycan/xylan/chitin deacetylase (PgdA/CDA1 family)